MKKKDIIADYEKEKKSLENKFRMDVESEIRHLLSYLNDNERVILNSDNCDGDGIKTGTYDDVINFVDKKHRTIVYNDQCFETRAYTLDGEYDNIFYQNIDVLIEVLRCVRKHLENSFYFKNKQIIEKQKELKNELKEMGKSIKNIRQDYSNFFKNK